jgi:hypothetical protein
MAGRFGRTTAMVLDPDGIDRVYEVVLDDDAAATHPTPVGTFRERRGYLRCRGPGGGVCYAAVQEFDGAWRRVRGHVVSGDADNAHLHAELETFCRASGVAARYSPPATYP